MADAAPTAVEPSPVSSLERLTTLSDAVFAFGATLLATRLIAEGTDTGTESALDTLRQQAGPAGLYVVGFLAIGYQWWRHHRLVRVLERADGALITWNLLVLGCIAVLPYPTRLLGESRVPLAVVMFVVPLIASSLGMAAMLRHARRHGLLRRGLDPSVVNAVGHRLLVLPAVLVASLVLLPMSSMWSMVAWLTILPAAVLLGRARPDRPRDDPTTPEHTDDALARLLGFSDAVYAVVLTLLADQLDAGVMPGADLTQDQLWNQVSGAWTTFVAFALTFYTAGLFWTIHLRTMSRAVRIDTVLLWVVLVHLMLVALQPFALSLFADDGFTQDRGATAIYFATLLVTEVSITVVALVLHRRPGLMGSGTTQGQRRAAMARAAMATSLFALALALSLVLPQGQTGWAFMAFLGFNALDPVSKRLDPSGSTTSSA